MEDLSTAGTQTVEEIARAAEVAGAQPESGIHIALAAERVGELFGIPLTNTLITSWVVMAILFGVAFFVGRNLQMVPGRLQALFEETLGFILNYMAEVLEDKKLARKLFPFITTLFLFIFTSNIIEFTPGIGSIGFIEYSNHGESLIPLFRSVNTDLNVTLALAIISFIVIEAVGIATLGFMTYAGKFFNFKSVLGFLVGIIELFSEIARLISFSFRLFGNILAGEVLIVVILFFVPYLVPVPMMLFETFVGMIQAAIFALLTLFFIKIAITQPH
jgi:F-type H+-transporting ATPase subunit a